MPKSIKKLMNFSDGFSIDVWSNLKRFWEPFGLPNRCQNQWKNISNNSLIFGRLFHEKWSQNGGPGDPKWRPRWRNFVDISPPPPRSPPGEGLGRVLYGFWEDFGGFWMVLGGFWEDFEWTLGRFLIDVSEVFWLKLVFSQERPKQENGPIIDAKINEKLES